MLARAALLSLSIAAACGSGESNDAPEPAPSPAKHTAEVAQPAKVTAPPVIMGTCLELTPARIALAARGGRDVLADLVKRLPSNNKYGGLLGTPGSGAAVGGGWGSGGVRGLLGRGGGTGSKGGLGVGRALYGDHVRVESLTVTGSLSKARVRRVLRRKLAPMRRCYRERLAKKPGIGGRVTVSLQISPTGRLLSAGVRGFDDELAGCMRKLVRKLVFPKPPGGGLVSVRVNYALSTSTKKKGTWLLRRRARVIPVKRTGPPGVRVEDHIRANIAPLQRCWTEAYGKDHSLFGTLRVRVRIDGRGEPEVEVQRGVASDLDTCAKAAIESVPFPAGIAGPRWVECAFGMGRIDVVGRAAGAPRLEVGGRDVRVFDGRGMVGTAELMAQQHLRRALDTVRKQAGLRSVGTDPRFVVMAFEDSVRFRDVMWVVETAAAGGYTVPLFQARRGGKWVFASVPQIPSVAPNPALMSGSDLRPNVRVTANAVIAAARLYTTHRHRIEDQGGEPDLGALVKWLATRGSSAELRHRRDLVVSAAPNVPYERVMRVVDAVATAGFADVRLARAVSPW